MFKIYIKDFNRNGSVITTEELIETIPAENEGALRLLSPIIKNDMGNAETFNFNIESGINYYDAFLQMKTFMRVEYDDETIFYGRVLTIDNGMFGTRKVRMEGPLTFFNDSPVEGVKEASRRETNVYEYLQSLIDNHNNWVRDSKRTFALGEVPGNYSAAVSIDQQVITNADVVNKKRKFGSDGWTDTKSALEDLRSHYGGYFRTRIVNGTIVLDWMNHYFNSEYNTQTIEIGKNILDINSVTEIDNIFTILVPIGNNKTTKTTSDNSGKKGTVSAHFYVDGREISVPSICSVYTREQLNSGYHKYEDYEQALDKYGRIIKTVTFDDATNAAQLRTKAYEWIKNNYQGEVTKFTVKAIDMRQIGENAQKIMVGDRVKLIYPVPREDGTVHKQELYQTCLTIQYDLYNPENNQYTFGIPANILTKTYGLTKQSKSVNSGGSRRNGDTSTGGEEEKDWLDEVYNWLTNHKIWYKHNDGPVPYTDAFAHKMGGPFQGAQGYLNWFCTHEDFIGGKFLLWRVSYRTAWKTDAQIAAISNTYNTRAKVEQQYAKMRNLAGEQAATEFLNYFREREWVIQGSGLGPQYIEAFTSSTLMASNLIDYIKDEYGIDVRTGLAVKMPSKLTLDDGSYFITEQKEDPETGEKGVFTKSIFDSKTGCETFFNEDGLEITSWRDSNGFVHYYVADPDSPDGYKETTDRQLAFQTLDNERAHGQLVQAYFRQPIYEIDEETGDIKRDANGVPIQATDENGNPLYKMNADGKTYALEPYSYMFAQTIESYMKGTLVTAHVDGDKVLLGSKHTKQSVRTALENISDVCGEFYIETDPITGLEKVVVVEGTAMIQKKDGAEFGYYHEGNLTAGIMVDMINNESNTYILGDHIKIGRRGSGALAKDVTISSSDESTIGIFSLNQNGDAILEGGTKISRTVNGAVGAYGLWDESGQNVSGGMLVTKINSDTTTAITGDHIKIGNNGTKDITLTAADSSTVGLYTIVNGDPVLDGGTQIYRTVNGVRGAYGIWDSSGQNVSGGMIVNKINDQSSTQILGTKVNIQAQQMAAIGIYTEDHFDAGYIVQKLNSGDTESKITSTIISLDADKRISLNDRMTIYSNYLVADTPFVVGSNITNGAQLSVTSSGVSLRRLTIYKDSGSQSQLSHTFTYDSIGSMIKTAELTNNDTVLKLTRFDNTVVNFSKAASSTLYQVWSGSSGNQKWTVETRRLVNGQYETDNSLSIGFSGSPDVQLSFAHGDVTRYETTKNLILPVWINSWETDSLGGESQTKRYETSLTINASDFYDSAVADVGLEIQTLGASATVNGNNKVIAPKVGGDAKFGYLIARSYGEINKSAGTRTLSISAGTNRLYSDTIDDYSLAYGDCSDILAYQLTSDRISITSEYSLITPYRQYNSMTGTYTNTTRTVKFVVTGPSAITTQNIDEKYIANGIVVKVGTSDDPGSIKNVTGKFTSVVSSGQTKATASHILTGYSAFVDGAEVKGEIPTAAGGTRPPTGSTQNAVIKAGTYVTSDLNIGAVTTSGIDAGNIKYGVTVKVGNNSNATAIKSVEGKFTSVVSSGQNKATASHIVSGYSAFVDGAEVKGNMNTAGGNTYAPTGSTQTVVNANTYVTGDVKIGGVTTTGIDAANIKYNTVVKVGTSSNSGSIKNVTGTFTSIVSSGQTKATASQILKGYSAFVDGAEVKGSATGTSATSISFNVSTSGHKITATTDNGVSKDIGISSRVGTWSSGSITVTVLAGSTEVLYPKINMPTPTGAAGQSYASGTVCGNNVTVTKSKNVVVFTCGGKTFSIKLNTAYLSNSPTSY